MEKFGNHVGDIAAGRHNERVGYTCSACENYVGVVSGKELLRAGSARIFVCKTCSDSVSEYARLSIKESV